MKKILLTVMVILIAVFFVTCDEGLGDDADIEYTDVVYSPDGSQVTVYLDGATVPVTKAQRAMTRDLAMMSYDFLEVIFISSVTSPAPTQPVVRANWELGQPAGLYGVNRDATDYSVLANACLFVGKKSDKTLFGIGRINPSPTAVTPTCVLTDSTQSVTFHISAILSGLQLKNTTTDPVLPAYTANPNTNIRGVAYDSMGKRADEDVTLGGVIYPLFYLTNSTGASFEAGSYRFGMVQNAPYLAAAKLFGTANYAPAAQRRTPRFMDGGSYREPKTLVNSKTTVAIGAFTMPGPVLPVIPPTIASDGTATFLSVFPNGVVPLAFHSLAGATGYLSFYLEIPVYNTNNKSWVASPPPVTTPTADDIALSKWTNPVTWYIRSGYGSELYSIDDGTSSGGCVLLGRGTSGSSDWLEIEWRWLPYTP